MDLIPVSKNILVNIDLIESVEIRERKGNKTIVISVGGRQYVPDIDSSEILQQLVKKGSNKLVNQFFAV